MSQAHGFDHIFSEKVQNVLDRLIRDRVCVGASIAMSRFGEFGVRCDSGLICTVDDYFKFAKMPANRGRTDTGEVLITEESLKLISEPRLNVEQRKSFPQEGDMCLHAAGHSYGYGVHVMKEPKNHLPVGEWAWAELWEHGCRSILKMNCFGCMHSKSTPSNYKSYIPEISKLLYSSLQKKEQSYQSVNLLDVYRKANYVRCFDASRTLYWDYLLRFSIEETRCFQR